MNLSVPDTRKIYTAGDDKSFDPQHAAEASELLTGYTDNLKEMILRHHNPELKKKINVQRVIDFYRDELGIELKKEEIEDHIFVLPKEHYEEVFGNDRYSASYANFTAETGDITLSVKESDQEGDLEIWIAHEITHLLGQSSISYYYTLDQDNRLHVRYAESSIGLKAETYKMISRGGEQIEELVRIGDFFEEGLALWVDVKYAKKYPSASPYIPYNMRFSGYYSAFDSLLKLITETVSVTNSNYSDLSSVFGMLEDVGINIQEKNWVIRLMFRAKVSSKYENVLRKLINAVTYPFEDFYDELEQIGQSTSTGRGYDAEYNMAIYLEQFLKRFPYNRDDSTSSEIEESCYRWWQMITGRDWTPKPGGALASQAAITPKDPADKL